MGETLNAVGGVRDAPSLDEPPERVVGGKLGVGDGLLVRGALVCMSITKVDAIKQFKLKQKTL